MYDEANCDSGGLCSDSLNTEDSSTSNLSQGSGINSNVSKRANERKSHADSSSRKRKREVHKQEDNAGERKRQETERAYLPREIISMILSRALDREPRCALDLLVPDWHICTRQTPALEEVLENTRVVTYTRGAAEGEQGTLSCNHRHHDDDHILLPMKELDERLLKIDKWCYNEAMRAYFQDSVQAFQLTADDHLPGLADESYLANWRYAYPIRGQRAQSILPYDDEHLEMAKLQTPLGAPHVFSLLRHIVVHSPLELLNVDARSALRRDTGVSDAALDTLNTAFDLDRASHLYLSWSQMPMLESVLLDLRVYSTDLNTDRGCISKKDIISRAQEMGRWLRLNLLVIAGLQSYSFFEIKYEDITAEQVENEDGLDGEPNWIKLFAPALRPGGKLVLVDRLLDDGISFGPTDLPVTP
ncbi:hypothetical protein F5B20DRAFT_574654 [Whalleya microplaca]|nr:hypothetical protein F5B20DRAFT_574654 [Whalleya microplaca]